MPAVLRATTRQALQARQWDGRNRSGMSPTAFAFLIPVFILFFFAPFLCVYFVRKRRQPPPAVVLQTKQPAMGRAEAKEILESVTEVVNVTRDVEITAQHEVAEEGDRVDRVSMLEKDCTICLSTLYTPSPPEPVKLSHEATTVDLTAKAPSVKSPSSLGEEILRLKVCGHEFHAECLVSWFAIRKTSCPICRATYYIDETKTASVTEGQVTVIPTAASVTAENQVVAATLWEFMRTGQTTMAPRATSHRTGSRWQIWSRTRH